VVSVNGPKGLVLELIGRKRETGFEIPSLARPLDGPREDAQRPNSLPMPMETK
jgi:hypothetical protein